MNSDESNSVALSANLSVQFTRNSFVLAWAYRIKIAGEQQGIDAKQTGQASLICKTRHCT